jgi:hypothetical protein
VHQPHPGNGQAVGRELTVGGRLSSISIVMTKTLQALMPEEEIYIQGYRINCRICIKYGILFWLLCGLVPGPTCAMHRMFLVRTTRRVCAVSFVCLAWSKPSTADVKYGETKLTAETRHETRWPIGS